MNIIRRLLRRPANERTLATDAIGLRLEQLAASLTPDARRLSELEAPLMAAFRESVQSPPIRASGAGSAWAGSWRRRAASRPLALGFTAVLLVASASLAPRFSDPGEFFYHLRLNVEELSRPAAGSPDRYAWDAKALSARLTEAAMATDEAAVADAATAYTHAFGRALGSAADSHATEALGVLLDQQVSWLAKVLDAAPLQSKSVLLTALAAVEGARETVAAGLPVGGLGPDPFATAEPTMPGLAPTPSSSAEIAGSETTAPDEQDSAPLPVVESPSRPLEPIGPQRSSEPSPDPSTEPIPDDTPRPSKSAAEQGAEQEPDANSSAPVEDQTVAQTASPSPDNGDATTPDPGSGIENASTPNPGNGSGNAGTPEPGIENASTPNPGNGSGNAGTPEPGIENASTPNPGNGNANGHASTPNPGNGNANGQAITPSSGDGVSGSPNPESGNGS